VRGEWSLFFSHRCRHCGGWQRHCGIYRLNAKPANVIPFLQDKNPGYIPIRAHKAHKSVVEERKSVKHIAKNGRSSQIQTKTKTKKGNKGTFELTKLNPKIILHQNSTLFNSVRFRTHGSLCTITIGICIIIMKNPYPLNLRVIHPMTNSCASELITNVTRVANGRVIVVREAE